MDNLKILNSADVAAFISAAVKRDGARAIKGPPPTDARYSDGTPCTQPVNIGWMCKRTAARIRIIYG